MRVRRFDAEEVASGPGSRPEPPAVPPRADDADEAQATDRPGADEGDTLLPGDDRVAELRHEVDAIDGIVASPLPSPSFPLHFGPDTFPPPPSDPTPEPEGTLPPELSHADPSSQDVRVLSAAREARLRGIGPDWLRGG